MKTFAFRSILLTLFAGVMLAGCATVKGAGRDIESIGQAGEDVLH